MEPLAVRAASAQRLAVYLVGIGGLALVGASLVGSAFASPFSPGFLFGAHVLLMGVAVFAAVLEWTRARLSEAVATPALLLAAVLTFVDIASGLWYFAPWLGVLTIIATFALVQRYLVRDEARHIHGA